jgi:hypothetical protein
VNSKEKIKTAKKHGVSNNKNALKKIDANGVYKLALRFWTKSEIASFFDCHADTITNRFQDIYTKGIEQGKAKLRDIQMKSAVHGNVTMQIWLGKQYLKQTDKQETDITLPTEIIIELPSSFTDED